MTSYVVRRLGYGLLVAWAAVTILFVVVRVLPGDPALVLVGPSATPEQLAAVRAQFGLDQSVLAQYVEYLTGLLQLDLGDSIRLGGSAMGNVVARLPASLALAAAATGIAVAVGLPIGTVAAVNRDGRADRWLSTGLLVGQSVPPFWLGVVLLIVFSRGLGWFPSSGADTWTAIILPSVALAVPFTAVVGRLVRGGLLDVIPRPYMAAARAKGLSATRVVVRHGIPNMLIPVVTVVGLQFGALIGGAVVVEVVFGWPGVGRLLIDAISGRDYPVVQAAVAVLAMVFVVVNLLVDISYGFLDPRVRLGSGRS